MSLFSCLKITDMILKAWEENFSHNPIDVSISMLGMKIKCDEATNHLTTGWGDPGTPLDYM
jgi:hypothetical protein